MERLRKAMAEDSGLFPDIIALKKPPIKGSTPADPISIVSSSSSVDITGLPVSKPHPKSRRVVISDPEDEGDGAPSRPHHSNIRANAGSSRPHPLLKAAVPIHVPSNKDLYSGPLAARKTSNEEAFDIHGPDLTDDPRLSAAEAQKALQDLVADVYEGDIDQNVSVEDAIVDGFQEGVTLLPHQVIGRRWMAERESGKKYGGLLADDMGLGKTIQTLTRIVEGLPTKADMKSGFARATLVVCPVAVVGQWASEIKKMTSGLKVIEHHGPSRTTDPSVLSNVHVVVTSYSIVSSEHAAYEPSKDEGKPKKKHSTLTDSDENSDDSVIGRTLQKKRASKTKDALFRVKWWRIVLDEAHNIKNRNTKAALACCALEAKYRWCLTGTPMQNNVEELYSLIKFLRLKPLSDWQTFKEQVALPVKNDHPVRAMKRLQVVLKAVMLRRTKNTELNGKPLLNLPDRIVSQIHCEFDPEEKSFYDTVEERVRESFERLQQQGGMTKAYTSMLVLLLRMRQACNHPSLVSQDYKKDKEAVDPKAASKDNDDDLADDLADMFGGLGLSGIKHCQVCQIELKASNKGQGENCKGCDDVVAKARRKSLGPTSQLPVESAKTRKVMSILDDIEKRSQGVEKTIIFSQFTSMLDILEPFLKEKGIRYVRYDGSMNKIKREESLDKIKSSSRTKVILISFKAGSTGLNLTVCNNVILVDLWWNPALEDQAFDRAHRLGQTRAVNIYKLSVPNTVEERILELQEKKRALANAALSGDKLKNMRLGMDDLMALFGNHEEHDEE